MTSAILLLEPSRDYHDDQLPTGDTECTSGGWAPRPRPWISNTSPFLYESKVEGVLAPLIPEQFFFLLKKSVCYDDGIYFKTNQNSKGLTVEGHR